MKYLLGFVTALILAVVLRYTNLDLFLVGWFSCMVYCYSFVNAPTGEKKEG